MRGWIVQYWAEALFGVVCGALAAAYRHLSKRLQRRSQEDAALKDGVLAILHDRIYAECMHCISEDGITVEAMHNLECLYEAYHALGGNGTGTELYNRATALKIKEE